MDGKDQEERPRTRWINQIRKDIKMSGENWEETAQEFSVTFDPYLWKQL